MAQSKNKTFEIKFDAPEAFALAIQHTTDGDRITATQKQSEADKQHAEQQQPQLV